MTTRNVGGQYTLSYNAENKLAEAQLNGVTQATYTYDGDGTLVKKVVGGETTIYVGAHFEKNVTTGEITKSYTLGSRRMAMRRGSTLTYLHGDHLGSASMTTTALGGVDDNMRYYPYGGPRSGTMATDRRFTGQREETAIGLYDYRARYYDPVLGRFIQADTIVPDGSKGQYNIGEHSCGQRNSRLTTLTTDLGEFVEQVNAENHQLQLRDLSPRRIDWTFDNVN